MRIDEAELPKGAMINAYAAREGFYTDCFTCDVAKDASLDDFMAAFYTTPLFWAERLVLWLMPKARSTDADLAAMIAGSADHFAAWKVESRATDQIVMDAGRTKSWFMVVPNAAATQLYFGSVVVPEPGKNGKKPRLGPVFDTLMGAHKIYSRLLLGAAARKLMRAAKP